MASGGGAYLVYLGWVGRRWYGAVDCRAVHAPRTWPRFLYVASDPDTMFVASVYITASSGSKLFHMDIPPPPYGPGPHVLAGSGQSDGNMSRGAAFLNIVRTAPHRVKGARPGAANHTIRAASIFHALDAVVRSVAPVRCNGVSSLTARQPRVDERMQLGADAPLTAPPSTGNKGEVAEEGAASGRAAARAKRKALHALFGVHEASTEGSVQQGHDGAVAPRHVPVGATRAAPGDGRHADGRGGAGGLAAAVSSGAASDVTAGGTHLAHGGSRRGMSLRKRGGRKGTTPRSAQAFASVFDRMRVHNRTMAGGATIFLVCVSTSQLRGGLRGEALDMGAMVAAAEQQGRLDEQHAGQLLDTLHKVYATALMNPLQGVHQLLSAQRVKEAMAEALISYNMNSM